MKIAILGPKGTYSDIAADKYLKDNNLDYERVYYPTIIKAAKSVDKDTIAIVPFENTLDGFVMESLDRVIEQNLNIKDQLKLSIDFAFVTNADSIKKVKTCYCQFKAYGQCVDFIADQDFTVIKTDSNVQSADMLDKEDETFGAIIPMHVVRTRSYKTVIPHVADSKKNETRFFILEEKKERVIPEGKINVSFIVSSKEDRPGLLFNILSKFHALDINLNAILSRPSKTDLGRYNFYMEGILEDKDMVKVDFLVSTIKETGFIIEMLGVYPALEE